MKIAIVGTISKDIIIPDKDIPCKSLGGIFYSITTLLNFLKNDEVILPISYYSNDISFLIQAFEEKWKNVDFSHLLPVKERNFQQIFEYSNNSLSSEKAFFFFPKLCEADLCGAEAADFILFNMISGLELDVDVFQKFTQNIYDKTYLNIKSLVYDVDSLGNKIPKRPDNIFDWLNYTRFIQLNEKEFEIINQEGIEFNRYWSGLLRPSQNVFFINEEKEVLWITNKDELKIKKYPSYPTESFRDKTGYGEVFGAAFAYSFLKTHNISKALEFGVLAANASNRIVGTENQHKLADEMNSLNTKILEAVY